MSMARSGASKEGLLSRLCGYWMDGEGGLGISSSSIGSNPLVCQYLVCFFPTGEESIIADYVALDFKK